MTTGRKAAALSIHRQLAADGATLDLLVEPAADGHHLRWFGRTGIAPSPAIAALEEIERRSVSGAFMIEGRLADPDGLALPLPGTPPPPARPETEFLSGRHALFAFRFAETPATIIEWIAYHARQTGATGAVIVNRAPPDPIFAGTLAECLKTDPSTCDLDFRLVILDSPVPLGHPDGLAETHPIMAPDAPGKDRMEPPDPDPWRAPLAEPLIYEAVKWRFLRDARAVLAIDCCDLIAPVSSSAPAENPFDRCVHAPDGMILLVGHRAYPWRVRNHRDAAFSDHICRQFDARRGIARWGVAPAKAGLAHTWRGVRVAYVRPDGGPPVPFLRAMALKVPDRKAAVLAPKSALVEDPELLRLAQEVFGANPVRPPAHAMPEEQATSGRTVIVTTMKNEGPFILEWIAYHRAIGVDDFLIYTNDCTDGTDRLLDVLAERGIVTHRANPYRDLPPLKPQHAALQAAEEEEIVRTSGWVVCMDVDEFIDIRLGDGRLPALFAAMGDANMIALTWRMFGNADVAQYEDRFILEQFTEAAAEMTRKPHQAWGFKTLFRNIALYKKLGVHRPKGLRPDLWGQVRWLNGSGRPMPREIIRNGWRSSAETFGYDWVSLNHYACRSAESFLVKRDRGRVNHVDRDQGVNYWFRMNHNTVRETSILARLPLLRAEWARLLADPEIRAAHETCVAAHRARIAALRERPEQQALYDELTGERMRALSRMLSHFGAAVFAAGPHVIPDDLHRRPISDDFFFTVEHEGDANH